MSFTENLYLKRMIQQLNEENLKLRAMLSEQFQFVRDVTSPYAPEGHKASLFKHANGQHIVVSHGGNYDPRAEGEVQGQPHETAVFHSDEFGNMTGNPAMTLSGHRDHETVARQFAAQMGGSEGGEGAVDMPTNPFPVRGTGRSYTSKKYSGSEFGHSPSESKPEFGHSPSRSKPIPSHRQR